MNEWPVKLGEDLVGGEPNLLFGSGLQDDRKLISGQPGDELIGPHRRPEPVGESAEQRVARIMTERVVDQLEIVDVEHEQRKAAVSLRRLRQAIEFILENDAVGQARQWIMIGHPHRTLFGGLLVRNVPRHDQKAR